MPNRYVETVGNARLFKTPDSTNDNNYGTFPNGAKFIYDGVVDGMVSVIFGNANGMKTNAYIPMSKCQCSDTLVEDYKVFLLALCAV